MKINNILYGIIATVGLAATTSCTDVLDDAYGKVVASQYSPKTEAERSYLVNAAYMPWRWTMLQWNGIVRSQELTADQDMLPARLGIGWVDGYIYKRQHEHKWTSDDDGVYQGWYRTFQGITTCNRVLNQIETGAISMDDEAAADVIAELKVLRASYYYLLCDLYGNVPITTDFADTNLPEQSTRKEVFDFVVREISENIDRLSKEPRGIYYGRMNQWVAHTLLAKMYLNAEVWIGEAMYDKVVEECDKVMDFANATGSYALETDLKAPFKTNNENSIENIYALPMDENYTNGWNDFDFHMYTLPAEMQMVYNFTERPWGGVCHIPQFVDSFDPDDLRWQTWMIYGLQYDLSGNPIQCEMAKFNGDVAGSNGKYGDMVFKKEVASIDESYPYDGYRWGKFEYAIGSTNRLSNDFPVFRYADILLMKAESLLRLGRPGAGELVTMVRKRAFTDPEKASVSDSDLAKGSSYDYGRRDNKVAHTFEGGDDIQYGRMLDELGWEFFQEGRRRQDLIRFGVFTTKSWMSHDSSDKTKELFPIPLQAIQTNSNLKQNPGY